MRRAVATEVVKVAAQSVVEAKGAAAREAAAAVRASVGRADGTAARAAVAVAATDSETPAAAEVRQAAPVEGMAALAG